MRPLKQLRQDARRIFAAGVAAVDPAKAVKRYLRRRGRVVKVGDRRYDLSEYRHLYVVGAGKASARMARAVEDIFLGESIDGGIVTVKYGYSVPAKRINIVEAGHPLPDPAGVRAARRVIATVDQA